MLSYQYLYGINIWHHGFSHGGNIISQGVFHSLWDFLWPLQEILEVLTLFTQRSSMLYRSVHSRFQPFLIGITSIFQLRQTWSLVFAVKLQSNFLISLDDIMCSDAVCITASIRRLRWSQATFEAGRSLYIIVRATSISRNRRNPWMFAEGFSRESAIRKASAPRFSGNIATINLQS